MANVSPIKVLSSLNPEEFANQKALPVAFNTGRTTTVNEIESLGYSVADWDGKVISLFVHNDNVSPLHKAYIEDGVTPIKVVSCTDPETIANEKAIIIAFNSGDTMKVKPFPEMNAWGVVDWNERIVALFIQEDYISTLH